MTELEKEVIYSTFKYGVGDVLKVSKQDMILKLPINPEKEYKDNLRVVYRFYDGNHGYVLESDDGCCLVLLEDDLELVEKAPVSVKNSKKIENKTKHSGCEESFYLGYVYKVNSRMVVSDSIENAISLFREHPSHKVDTIESIKLLERDCAIVQIKEEAQPE